MCGKNTEAIWIKNRQAPGTPNYVFTDLNEQPTGMGNVVLVAFLF